MPSEPAGDRYAYLDPSAIVKLVVVEAETAALENDVARRAGLLTSRLGVTEAQFRPELLEGIWDELHGPAGAWVKLGAAPRLATATFEGDLAVVLERLAAAGSPQAIAVDLTRRDCGIPVVKCLVPGRATAVDLLG